MDLVDLCSRQLASACNRTEEAVRPNAARLIERHNEPHRHYHTTDHVLEVLDAIEQLSDPLSMSTEDVATAQVAAWYHDAIYKPLAAPGANEVASAELAVEELGPLGASGHLISGVDHIIRSTATHKVENPTNSALLALCDADLWILGASQRRFDKYCQQVRKEYSDLSDSQYNSARHDMLTKLGSGVIYSSTWAQQNWSTRAKENLKRELSRLAG